jgi:hypothetical protein
LVAGDDCIDDVEVLRAGSLLTSCRLRITLWWTSLSLVAMNQMPDPSGWLEYSRPAFKLRFLYPAVTPGGRPVEITEEEHNGAHRVHLTAREGGEI